MNGDEGSEQRAGMTVLLDVERRCWHLWYVLPVRQLGWNYRAAPSPA